MDIQRPCKQLILFLFELAWSSRIIIPSMVAATFFLMDTYVVAEIMIDGVEVEINQYEDEPDSDAEFESAFQEFLDRLEYEAPW